MKVLKDEFCESIQEKGLGHCLLLDEDLQFLEKHYICHNCKNHLSKSKMPPLCHANNLTIPDIPAELLDLTPMERQLIAKKIVFIKVRKMPRSRMGKMNDKVVNVPIR